MASGIYDKGLAEIMSGNIDLINADLSCGLVNSTLYTPDFAGHADLSSVPEAALISEADLTGKSLDNTTFRADDTVFPQVAGDEVSAVLIFVNADTVEASKLVCYLDSAIEFPITPDGTDITVRWDSGQNGIFRL